MIGQNIVIQFERKYASLYDGNKVEISDLFASEPFVSTLIATHRCHILATIKEYDQTRGAISIAIKTHNRGKGSFAENQSEIIDLLSSIKLIRILGGSDTMKWLGMEMRIGKRSKSTSSNFDALVTHHQISTRVIIPIEEISFNDRHVSFSYHVKELGSSIEIKVDNDYVIRYHNSLKPYFSNILGTKNLSTDLVIDYNKSGPSLSTVQVAGIVAFSKEINDIGPKTIEKVHLAVLKSKISEASLSEKQLLTKEDILKETKNLPDGNFLFDNDSSLFEGVLKIREPRHHQHLIFLSRMHEYEIMKLRLIAKPISFMFLVRGKSNYYFIWETFDTEEATYLWAIKEKFEVLKTSLRKKLEEIEVLLAEISSNGKNQYIQKKESDFTRIFHAYTEDQDGFDLWKKSLLNALK